MNFDTLPLELLEYIFSYLSFHDLLSKSLVCCRWYQVAGIFIGRRGQLNVGHQMLEYLPVLENSNRHYKAVSFQGHNGWKALRKILAICVNKCTPRTLHLSNVLHDHLNRLYVCVHDRRWFDRVENLSVSLDDRSISYLNFKRSDYRLMMPNLKCLRWTEYLRVHSNKSVTLIAPKLETVYLFDSRDVTAKLKILTCDSIQRIVCTLYYKDFDEVFCGRMSQLEMLLVCGGNGGYDFSFIERMPKLRWFEVFLRPEPEYLYPNLSSLYTCRNIESLMLSFSSVQDLPHGEIDLANLCRVLEHLKQVNLRKIKLLATGPVQADGLTFLRLSNAEFDEETDSLLLIAPKLDTLSMPMSILARTHIDNKSSVTKLYVDLESFNLKEALDLHLEPFVRLNETVRELTLWSSEPEQEKHDESEPEAALSGIVRMEIRRLYIGFNFFRSISKWESLKHLSLVLCSINCADDDENITLTGLETMNVDYVKVEGSHRYLFPLVAGSNKQLLGQSCIFSSNDFNSPVSLRLGTNQFISFDAFDP